LHVSFAVPRHSRNTLTHIGDTHRVTLFGAMYALATPGHASQACVRAPPTRAERRWLNRPA